MLKISLKPQKEGIGSLPGLPDWLSRLLIARGIDTEEAAKRFLNPKAEQLSSPLRLHEMDKAKGLIFAAKQAGKRAVIYGDYDVDGVSASAILWEALGSIGLEREVYIPDRHQEGYGLNLTAVEKLAADFQLLITVDCGITSINEVKRARELGMDVIVTDHHRHGDSLPPAQAVVSPMLGNAETPYLCGAGVAFKLASALLGDGAMKLLELAALATVADMVPLIGENRVIVALGLKQLEKTSRPGLRALMNRAGVQGRVTSDQVGFQIAPRMNACGRMESAQTALRMLITRDPREGEELAIKMEELNQERKNQETLVLEEALSQVSQMDLIGRSAIVVWGEGWNSGVVGLAAGRVAEKYCYPTVALAKDGDLCVGSARSAGDIDIYQALKECEDLFLRFGGHKQAAGLTLPFGNVESFFDRFSKAVFDQTGGRKVIPEIICDGALSLHEVTEETVLWLSRLEPFGMGNPSPRFIVEGAEALSLRAVGSEGRHLKCTFQQGHTLRDGIFFGGGDRAAQGGGQYRLAISPTVNEFRGKITPECRLYAMELLPSSLKEDLDREGISLFDADTGEGTAETISFSDLQSRMTGSQGTLLVCRTLKTALHMQTLYPQADFCLEKADDVRAFHSILLYGDAKKPCAPFRHVVLCDGFKEEASAWQKACPGATVEALVPTEALEKLLASCFISKDALRQEYAYLRGHAPYDLYSLSRELGLAPRQAAFGLRVLSEIGLLSFSLSPFQLSLFPMVKRGPEESGLYTMARRAKEETDGLHGL